MGGWISFNVGTVPVGRNASCQVVPAYFEEGGRLIDSSPITARSSL